MSIFVEIIVALQIQLAMFPVWASTYQKWCACPIFIMQPINGIHFARILLIVLCRRFNEVYIFMCQPMSFGKVYRFVAIFGFYFNSMFIWKCSFCYFIHFIEFHLFLSYVWRFRYAEQVICWRSISRKWIMYEFLLNARGWLSTLLQTEFYQKNRYRHTLHEEFYLRLSNWW